MDLLKLWESSFGDLPKADASRNRDVKTEIKSVLERPDDFVADEQLGAFAKAVIEAEKEPTFASSWTSAA